MQYAEQIHEDRCQGNGLEIHWFLPTGVRAPIGVAGCVIEQTSVPVRKDSSTPKAGSDASFRHS